MIDFDIAVQRQVIAAALDDFSPNAALPDLHGGQYGSSSYVWRSAVTEFIRAMLSAQLIAPLAGREGYRDRSAEEICEILRNGDSTNGHDVELVWNAMYFEGTEKLRRLLQSLNLASWEARDRDLSPSLGMALAKMRVVSL